MFKGDLLTSVYECVLAFYASSVLSFLIFFFFPTSCRQLLIHIIYGTPATGVCVGGGEGVSVWVSLCGNSQARFG